MKLLGLVLASLLLFAPLASNSSENYEWFGPAKVRVVAFVSDPYDGFVNVSVVVDFFNESDVGFTSGYLSVQSISLTFERYSKIYYYNYSKSKIVEWDGSEYNVTNHSFLLYFPLESGNWILNVTVMFVFAMYGFLEIVVIDVPVSVSVNVNVPGQILGGGGINIPWINVLVIGVLLGLILGVIITRRLKK